MIGFNFRMTEIEAAIAYEQLDLLDEVVAEKQRQARNPRLAAGLGTWHDHTGYPSKP